ncbi:RDD family protein [Actinomadura madurae]|uniref:RDD family protein n=1 Tax=Actinomadura madurae TaxID=1993 RepID=UPI0020D22558|nr:RDD family protein [Actinomadura madurae]MCP9979494.1 RDD family protein [Actinomadura madurae]
MSPAGELASRWARLGAGLVDLIIVGIVTVLISIPFVNWDRVFDPEPGDSMYNGAQVGTNAVSVVLAFLYYWLMHAKWGQTLGKMLLGIRVVRDDDGLAITTGQAVGRSAFYSVLGGICGCVGLVDVLWILWDPRKQALHCKVARTVVVKADPHRPNPLRRSLTCPRPRRVAGRGFPGQAGLRGYGRKLPQSPPDRAAGPARHRVPRRVGAGRPRPRGVADRGVPDPVRRPECERVRIPQGPGGQRPGGPDHRG